MNEQAIAIFCFCDDLLKKIGHNDDPQCLMSSAEVMTFAFLSALYFECNFKKSQFILKSMRMFPKILSRSHLNRRIHSIPYNIWLFCIKTIQKIHSKSAFQDLIVDSFPIVAFQNHRSSRSHIFQHKKFHGYSASKKSYYFGIKVHAICYMDGTLHTFVLSEASLADVSALERLNWNLLPGTCVLGDKAYNHYAFEDKLLNSRNIRLVVKRKANSRRKHSTDDLKRLKKRNRIETVFSSITHMMPKCIRARTEKGFCLKVVLFIVAYCVRRTFPAA